MYQGKILTFIKISGLQLASVVKIDSSTDVFRVIFRYKNTFTQLLLFYYLFCILKLYISKYVWMIYLEPSRTSTMELCSEVS